MKLGLAALCLVVLVLCTQQARAESILIAWEQPGYEAGDTWEIGRSGGAWVPLVPIWGAGGVHSALIEASLPTTVVARTTRDGVVSEVSEPHVYVDEPSLSVGLLVGCAALAFSASRASRPRASQKWRSRNS